ncbi:ArsR family transcriptional regulator [Candidatus Bathyarchaeota archaeon]|nr:ArsR family transcriptional regulator [Candidatus Bathyarchaeota archaeon]
MRKRKELLKRTDATIEAFKTERLRWTLGISQMDVKVDEKKYRAATGHIMKDEVERQMIIGEIKEKGPLTISELSEATKISPKEILRHIIALRKTGVISEAGEKEDEYLYETT